MFLSAPSFWYHMKRPWWCFALKPFVWLFRLGACWRRLVSRPLKAHAPVISVGNLVMGGAGKTPIVIALCHALKALGFKPVIFCKGYGGKLQGPLWVDLSHHRAQDVGDEALLLAQSAPVVMSKSLKKACSLVPKKENVVFVIDDGHQQCQLKTDRRLLVVDHLQGFGNQAVFPQGPLREPLKKGLKRAHALCVVGGMPPPLWQGLPILRVTFHTKTSLKPGTKVWGVAGLGYPLKFRRTLDDLGLDVQGFSSFPDHYPYTLSQVKALEQAAHKQNAQLITTEKDWVRWPLGASLAHRVQLKACFSNQEALKAFLQTWLQPKSVVAKKTL